jgi:hypothetical protein
MKQNRFFSMLSLVLLLVLSSIALGACDALVSSREYDTAVLPKAIFIPITAAGIEACCENDEDHPASLLIDGSSSTGYWRASYSTEDGKWAHGSQHYINIDLGQIYDNISQIKYLPEYRADIDSHYDFHRNGIIRNFEIYVTKTRLAEGEAAPASALAAAGEWVSTDPNTVTADPKASSEDASTPTGWKIATFNGVSGRYIQLRVLSSYHDTWVSPAPKLAVGREIKIFAANSAYRVNKAGLDRAIIKTEALKAAYPAHYGYSNARLENWLPIAKGYIDDTSVTQEMVDLMVSNLSAYLATAPDNFKADQYNKFYPKALWADNKGNHIQAHGGGVLFDPVGKKWWFYGEDRTPIGWEPMPGVHGYSSTDLYNWKDEGLVLPTFNNTAYNTDGWRMEEWDEFVFKSRHSDPEDSVYHSEDPDAQVVFDPDYNPDSFVPSGNPPLYTGAGNEASPHPNNLGLSAAKMAQFNALYAGMSAREKKEIYRYYNFQSTIERPKVIYNADTGKYVLWFHVEGGFYRPNYGTARAAVAVADSPAGPFKFIWAYHTHFAKNYTNYNSHLGMSRDMNLLVDDADNYDGTGDGAPGPDGVKDAFLFSSTQENRIMEIALLTKDYLGIAGVPKKSAGESQEQMLAEGYKSVTGKNYNWGLHGDQREAPAPFIHYSDGSTSDLPHTSAKRYYNIHSGATGWFTNRQGFTNTPDGGKILGAVGHDHTSPTGAGAWPNGWGDSTSVPSGQDPCVGDGTDGSRGSNGFGGQTTNVFQLRYPSTKPDGTDEPRKGMLVPGKYVWMADAWEPDHLYDSRYIWLPLEMVGDKPEIRWGPGDDGSWRWEDFVYDTGDFSD